MDSGKLKVKDRFGYAGEGPNKYFALPNAAIYKAALTAVALWVTEHPASVPQPTDDIISITAGLRALRVAPAAPRSRV